MQYNVYGTVTISVACRVTANSEEEAVDAAYEEWGGINSYVGNGGTDKMIGVRGTHESIEADGEVEWAEAVPTGR